MSRPATAPTELYLVEYYRKAPGTGEPGWTIHFAWADAADAAGAVARVAAADPLFDARITCGRQADVFELAGLSDPLVLLSPDFLDRRAAA